MKYILLENRLHNTIEKFLKENYPIVYEVNFKTTQVALGSTEGVPTINRTTIEIVLNNSKNMYKTHELRRIGSEIKNKINVFFNLDIYEYGSEWDVELKQLSITLL
jgi:DnaJ-class molecular chaperone